MIVFLLEEPSMEAFLRVILQQVIKDEDYKLIPHEGKGDLLRSIPIKLKAWNTPGTKFVIVQDQDNDDCIDLKKKLADICEPYKRDVLIRIVCRELESWYFGDIQAVSDAYGKNLNKFRNSKKYSVPDKIFDPKAILKKEIPELTQIDGAGRIAKMMDINRNCSHSFKVFIDGIRRII